MTEKFDVDNEPSIAEKIAAIAEKVESSEPEEIQDNNKQIEAAVEKAPKEEPKVEEAPAVEAVEEKVEETPVPEKEVYEPNLKFKVYDEEKEFEDWVKPYINKDNEEKFRDLYTKAYGIDGIKKKLDTSRQELAAKHTEMNGLVSEISYLGNCIKNGNLEDVFKTLNIPQENIEKWMLRRLQMSPEERQEYEKMTEVRRKASTVENQYNDLNKKYNQIIAMQTQTEINNVLSDPSTKDFVAQVDERLKGIYGDNGFVRELGNVGVDFFNRNGYDLPVKEVVDLTLKKFGYVKQDNTQPTKPRAEAKPVVTKVIVNNKNTIPSVGSTDTASPTNKVYTSIDDLVKESKRLRKEGK